MSARDPLNSETAIDNVSTNSTDEGLPRDFSQISLTSTSKQDEFYSNGHSELALKNLYGYYRSQTLCDVVLIAEGCRIPAHKVVLSSCSEYFAAMFTGSMKEAKLNEISMERVDSTALQSLVHYCYTGVIELKEESVEMLLATASLLQLHAVTKACCTFLMNQLDPCNSLGIALFAEQQSCLALHKSALEYTYQHFMEVMKQPEFLSLHVDQLANLLKSDDLNVTAEEDVCDCVLTWVHHDKDNREKYLPTLLKLVKLPLLSSEYLIDKVEQTCGKIQECQPLIMEAVKWHLLPERRGLLASYRTRPRTSTIGRLLAIGGMDGNKVIYCYMYNIKIRLYWYRSGGPPFPMSDVCRWDSISRSWTVVAPMAGARSTCGVAVLGGRLYAAGGRDGGACLRSLECYNPATNHWHNCAPMTRRRCGLSICAAGGYLYALGGHEAPANTVGGRLACVERYDPSTDTWTLLARLSYARDAIGSCLLGDKIVAVGGYDGAQYLNLVEIYDTESNTWRNLAPLSIGRAGAAVVAIPPTNTYL
ncbi:Kelch-like protein 5 [Papilio machaon]|uniref:Kelch-like protein diablo n=1 Tax=Papilio machaon TaxID=76193 RepID=A0A194RR49_PAPMA|nr:Kelch-like protein 5 [Papilio machaon]